MQGDARTGAQTPRPKIAGHAIGQSIEFGIGVVPAIDGQGFPLAVTTYGRDD